MTTPLDAYPKFEHHGAKTGVTGSCHRYIANEHSHYLVDCGLFQGDGETQGAGGVPKSLEIEFDLSLVKALIITHVHIDHIGRLPYLMAAGFNGPIYCSIPSAELLPLVIEDALKVGFTRDKRIINQFLKKVGTVLRPMPYGEWVILEQSHAFNLRLQLKRAGHILGSAYVELDAGYLENNKKRSHRTVFSGDLGAPYAPLLPAPKSPRRANTLVIESTYGDKIHENRKQRKARLKAAIEHALQNAGTVLIPAFSIGRTQELLYELEDLITRGNAHWKKLAVIIDSPLAAKFTQVYRRLKPYWDEEARARVHAGRHPLSFENLLTVGSHSQHQRMVNYLASSGRPAVVLAASGMVTGGRSLNYVKAMIEDPRHAILFVGYQARGTPGAQIQKNANNKNAWVEIDDKRLALRALVQSISGYSAHADQQDLLNFVRRMKQWPTHIRVVHGELAARMQLKHRLQQMAEAQGKAMSVWTAAG
ncbi:metallo-beta-lactamase family protein [Alteromonadaceae bacterium Bs31]|nr:metallo-beta-lactamase family protein [Alteromonadaceae bacterium Bs31]